MKIDNRKIERIEKLRKTRQIEDTEKEKEKDKQEQSNDSLKHKKHQEQRSNPTFKLMENEEKNKEPKRDMTVASISAVKAQMEGSQLGKIHRLRDTLNNDGKNQQKREKADKVQEMKRAQKGYEASIKIAEELAETLDER